MAPAPANPTPPTPNEPSKGVSLSSAQLIALFLAVLGVIVTLTLVLAFHYPKASDATSVLGVAIPALTAIVGAAVGGGAGNAIGAAGKKSVQQDLTQANRTLASAGTEVASIKANLEPLFGTLKRDLPSPAGESRLMLMSQSGGNEFVQDDNARGIDTTSLDTITASLGRLEGLVGGATAAAEPESPPGG